MPTQWGRKETVIWPPHSPIYTYGAAFIALVLTGLFLYMRFALGNTPLQRFYTPIYLRASLASELGAKRQDKYRLIFLTGVEVAPKMPVEADVQEGLTNAQGEKPIPLVPSQAALRNGFDVLFRGPETSFVDAALRDYLKRNVFNGTTLSSIYAEPLFFGILALAVQLPFSIRKDIKRRRQMKYGRLLKGPVMLTPTQFNQEIGGDGIGFRTTESKELMRIPARSEAQHIELMGDTGAGKTTLIMQVLRQIEERGHTAIVYDPACEFIQRFYRPDRCDIVLNPLDDRCPYWGPSEELRSKAEAKTLAKSLYQPTDTQRDEFFTKTPQKIFAHLLRTGPTPRQLADWMANPAEIDKQVRGTEMATMIAKDSPPQRNGVLSSLGLVADSLRMLPTLEDAKGHRWCATEWAETRRGWIFITSRPTERDALQPLHSLWIDWLVLRLLSAPKEHQTPVWFVLDELASLQRLPQLHTAITENRKSKNPLVLGFQGKAQLENIYGHIATAVYQSELMFRLKNLGYEIQPGRSGAPEIKGYSPEYLAASSPRRQQIEEALARSGFSSPEAAQIAAHTTRDRKQIMTPEKVLAAHRQIAEEFGNQADRVVKEAQERAQERQHSKGQKESDPQQKARESVSFSKARNFERDAVIDERAIMRDALRRGMGDVSYSEVAANFQKREAAGEFLKVEVPGQHSATRFTTRDMLHAERSNIDYILAARNTVEPIMSAEAASKFAGSVEMLNPAQRRTSEEVLSTTDRVHGLQGYAGSGKTTTLRSIREAAESRGYAVEGFAPTNRAANQLKEAGVVAETLQKFLTRGGSAEAASDPDAKRLYMVDESSLASTKQMQSFFEKIGSNDRVLLIGDIRQHQGVDAGKPFEQLQDAGMRTSTLDEIIRQQDEGLHRAVEHLSQGQTADGVRLLREQGRVSEAPERAERIMSIAKEYAAQPNGTLVISPDNASRVELNQAIRAELRERGGVRGPDTEFTVLVARSELNSEDRKWAAQYQAGDVLQYTRGSREIGVGPLGYATVRAVDEQANRLTVERQDGQQVSYDPKRLSGITAYREVARPFAEGDRLQFTTNDRDLGISNRQLATVEKSASSEMRVRLDGEERRTISFRPEQMRHFDHGYAVTSHSSQGLTADRVLINVEVSAHRDLINQRFAYVAVSRAAYDVRLYTDDGNRLEKDLGRDVSKSAAIETRPEKENTMNFQNEHADKKEPSKEPQRMPIEIYASSLTPEVVREDIRFAERQLEQGLSQPESIRNLTGDHIRRTDAEPSTLSLTERYATHITELVRHLPEQQTEKVLAILQPSPKDVVHWEPAINALGAGQSDSLLWRREHGDIQSYQRVVEPKGSLHIDSSGQFFDRSARMIPPEQALAHLGLTLSSSAPNEHNPSRALANGTGIGMSF